MQNVCIYVYKNLVFFVNYVYWRKKLRTINKMFDRNEWRNISFIKWKVLLKWILYNYITIKKVIYCSNMQCFHLAYFIDFFSYYIYQYLSIKTAICISYLYRGYIWVYTLYICIHDPVYSKIFCNEACNDKQYFMESWNLPGHTANTLNERVLLHSVFYYKLYTIYIKSVLAFK